jgi:transcription termination factor Rho
MAAKPTPDRSDLESKTREDLQTIAKVKGVDVTARASKSALIEAIMGDIPQAQPVPDRAVPESTRVVRSRRTVATPTGDFEDLIGEFASELSVQKVPEPSPEPSETAPLAAPSSNGAERQAQGGQRQSNQPRADRQPRDFGNEQGGRNRRNRRSRTGASGGAGGSGRERFGGEAQPNADQPYSGDLVEVEGLLDLRDDGYGFLRTKGFHPSPNDVYVSINQVRRYHLRKGDALVGGFRPAASNEKYPALLRVDSVAGLDPEVARLRPRFEDLTPLFPDEKLKLETSDTKGDLTPRIVDLIAPIGKGQRGLIVSPPKAGKTTVMKQIAQSIEANNPEIHLMVLLVDERPEEVTDMRRSVRGEVIASTFDRPAEEHTHIAELCIERAKRLVEQGRDVVIILDGITRLARAYNLAAPATGRIMSGGVDSGALYPPKKFFGAARNIEEGGSLTILASALVETGSKMDEVIFEEFKGTGNMELKLDRRLAERRLYPAIDVNGSSTRHEELLFDRELLPQVWKLRRVLNGLASEGREAAGLELLIDKLKSTRSNDEFLAEIGRGPATTS